MFVYMSGAFGGIAAGLISLSICIWIYKKIKNISLNDNQSPLVQKIFILLRIGLFWGFWWIVAGLIILAIMSTFKFYDYIEIIKYTITIVGWIVVPIYVLFSAYQLFFNKKSIKEFNKNYNQQ